VADHRLWRDPADHAFLFTVSETSRLLETTLTMRSRHSFAPPVVEDLDRLWPVTGCASAKHSPKNQRPQTWKTDQVFHNRGATSDADHRQGGFQETMSQRR